MLFQKYAPPLPNDFKLLEEAFYALHPIVHFCPHLGSKAKFPQECTYDRKKRESHGWECNCYQSRRFRNIFGRYIEFLYQGIQLPTGLTGTKIKNRAYGFRRRKRCLYFKLRRHPRVDSEYYEETEQRWCFGLDEKELILLGETRLGEHSAIV